MAGERAAGGPEIWGWGGVAAWVSKVAEQRPLTLPWPSELDGTQRGGEALRVGFQEGEKA